MLRQLIQKIKAMLLCIEYGILFVDTVSMKIKASNAFAERQQMPNLPKGMAFIELQLQLVTELTWVIGMQK